MQTNSKRQLSIDAQHSWSATCSTTLVRYQLDTDAAASAATTVMTVCCAELRGMCIRLGVSGVADTLVPKQNLIVKHIPQEQAL